jgi:hypothetical protein
MRLVGTAVAIPGDRLPESCEFYAALFGLSPIPQADGAVALCRPIDFTSVIVLRPTEAGSDGAGRRQSVVPRFTVSNLGEALATATRYRFQVLDVREARGKPSSFLTVDPNGVIIEVVAAYDPGELHERLR